MISMSAYPYENDIPLRLYIDIMYMMLSVQWCYVQLDPIYVCAHIDCIYVCTQYCVCHAMRII